MDYITSPDNDKIKMLVKLRNSAKERKYSGKYIVEGIRMVEEIPFADFLELYITTDFYEKKVKGNDELFAFVNKADNNRKVYQVTDTIMKKISDTETPQGILATVKMKVKKVEDLWGEDIEKPLILILEKIQDPGNMGTIIRSAEGAGVSGILVSYDSVDIYSPKVIRSTMGSIFRKNIVVTYDLVRDIKELKNRGIVIYGMHLKGTSMYETDLTGPVGLLIGNEGNGLSEEASEQADCLIRIPMLGRVESLNAAMAAGILMYEAARQHRTMK